jgi:hypothetical protein
LKLEFLILGKNLPAMEILSDPAVIWFLVGLGLLLLEIERIAPGKSLLETKPELRGRLLVYIEAIERQVIHADTQLGIG